MIVRLHVANGKVSLGASVVGRGGATESFMNGLRLSSVLGCPQARRNLEEDCEAVFCVWVVDGCQLTWTQVSKLWISGRILTDFERAGT